MTRADIRHSAVSLLINMGFSVLAIGERMGHEAEKLQKVREVGGDRYSYSSDYEIVTKLKSFSDKYGVCLLVVHHTRKLESEDSFDMISGTNGLLGAADGRLSCTRKSARTTRGSWILWGVTSPIRN